MAKDPAFPFYTQDFLVGTMYMTNEQVGIYIRLLCSQHQHGGLIDKIAFETAVGKHDIVRSKFVETEDGFYNERLMNEMIKRQKKSSNLSQNALKRWNQYKSNAKAMQMNMQCEIENENKDSKDFKRLSTRININKEWFDEIWSKYPKKDGRKSAERHFYATVKTKEDFDNINKALENYMQSKTVKNGYIKNGSTWFNNWQDWVDYVEYKTEEEKHQETLRRLGI